MARRTVGGNGASTPLTLRQRISFSSKSSTRSYSLKSILLERPTPYDVFVFFSSRFTWAFSQRYGDRSALSVKELDIGRAAASYWLNGGRPRISSIVRIMLTVLYCVLSTKCRFV